MQNIKFAENDHFRPRTKMKTFFLINFSNAIIFLFWLKMPSFLDQTQHNSVAFYLDIPMVVVLVQFFVIFVRLFSYALWYQNFHWFQYLYGVIRYMLFSRHLDFPQKRIRSILLIFIYKTYAFVVRALWIKPNDCITFYTVKHLMNI